MQAIFAVEGTLKGERNLLGIDLFNEDLCLKDHSSALKPEKSAKQSLLRGTKVLADSLKWLLLAGPFSETIVVMACLCSRVDRIAKARSSKS